MYSISKRFDFCYGHRVWSQELDSKLSCNSFCKCRHLHGHQGQITVMLTAEELQNGMVTDFTNLSWFKQWIDNNIDHKFIIDSKDPLLQTILDFYEDRVDIVRDPDTMFEFISPINILEDSFEMYELEHIDSFVIVDFVPTSENIAKWLFDLIQKKMPNVKVQSVVFNETPKTMAVYHGI